MMHSHSTKVADAARLTSRFPPTSSKMARTASDNKSTERESSPKVVVSSSVLKSLFARACATKGPHKARLVLERDKLSDDSKLLVDVKTAIILLDYSEGDYQTCGRTGCDEVLTLAEAISGRVSCIEHRDVAKLGSRAARQKKKVQIEELEQAKVRSCCFRAHPGH